MPDSQQVSEVVRHFGLSLLAYVCNVDEARIQAIANGEGALSGTNGQILDEAVATLKALRFQAAYEGVPVALLLTNIAHSNSTGGRHIFNIWREKSGGALLELCTEDPVLSALAPLAADAYPTLLLLPQLSEREPFAGMIVHPTYGHPSEKAFEEAVLSDSELSRLFSTLGENAIETTGYITASTGRGGSLQLATLASLFIQAAYVLASIRGRLNPDGLHKGLVQVVEVVRRAMRGENVQVPAFVGFNNIALEESNTVELPWGQLRPYTGAGAELIPSTVRPPVLGEEGTSLGFVLEAAYDYRLKVGEWTPSENEPPYFDWPESMQESLVRLDYQCQLTALAFSLGIERLPPVACTRMWTMIFDPLSYGANISWRPTPPSSPLEFYRADKADSGRVIEWAETLESTDDSKISISQHRLISALSECTDPVDGFIDAVIAWENLFGSRDSELSFRISTAMAKLLRDDPEDRLSMQRKIRDRYNLRSALIHGGKTIEPSLAVEERNAALEEVLACLRRLYREFPHLVNDSDRARKLVLSL
jgi:Apea-like HEPN